MAIEISWAKQSDTEDLEAIDEIEHEDNSLWIPQSKADFAKVIKKSAYLTLIAREDEKPIGYLQSGERNTKKHLWVENVMVLKKYRKQGVARKLVNHFIAHWKDQVDYIVLITPGPHVEAFERMGFEKEMHYMGYKYSRGKEPRA